MDTGAVAGEQEREGEGDCHAQYEHRIKDSKHDQDLPKSCLRNKKKVRKYERLVLDDAKVKPNPLSWIELGKNA